MKKLLSLLILLLMVTSVYAVEIEGINIPQSVSIENKSLMLNGYGIRKKFFINVYVGALYTTKKVTSFKEALADNNDRLIRMTFLYSKVDKEKIIEAFKEGMENNAIDVLRSEEANKFFSFFTTNFVKGDVVDLFLGSDGFVVVKQNGKVLGTMKSAKLVRGILAIYLGDKPADAKMKAGMLGNK